MKLSAPVHILKRRARRLSRTQSIPLHEALDAIATREGFASWSLLASGFIKFNRCRGAADKTRSQLFQRVLERYIRQI